MANRNHQNRLYSFNHKLTWIEGNCVIDSGAIGKTRSLKGTGVKSVTCMATGTYKITFEDSYPRYLGGFTGFVASYTGNVAIGSLNPTTTYIIRTLGNSTQAQWETAGVPAGVTAAVGLAFVAAATSAGTGTCFTAVQSGIHSVSVVGDPNLSVNNASDPHILIQTLGATAAGDTALIPTAPVDNSVLGFTTIFRNSTIIGKGE